MLVFGHEVVARFTGKCLQAREAEYQARTSLASGGDGDSSLEPSSFSLSPVFFSVDHRFPKVDGIRAMRSREPTIRN